MSYAYLIEAVAISENKLSFISVFS